MKSEKLDVYKHHSRENEVSFCANIVKSYYVRNYKRTSEIVHTMMDTGSNFNLSSCKEDFSSLESKPSIKITAVDGDVNDGKASGSAGKFYPNNLEIKNGVYFPQLGVGQRIVSGFSLLEHGWNIVLNKDSSRLESNGTSLPIYWRNDELPYLNMLFNHTNTQNFVPFISNKIKKRVVVEKLSRDKALELHKAAGHLYVPGINVEC